MTRKRIIRVCFLLLAILFLSFQLTSKQVDYENPPELFGTRDLIAFWAGTQVALQGGDPYQSAQVLSIEKLAMPSMQAAQFFLNPPWTLPLFSVFFSNSSFKQVRIVWIVLNIFFLFAAAFLIKKLYPTSRLSGLSFIAATFLFLPSLNVFWIGQLSLLIFFSLAAALYFWHRRWDTLAALCALPLTFKPHLVYLVFIGVGLCVLKEKRWVFLLSFVLGFATLCMSTVYLFPGSFESWLAMDFDPSYSQSSTLVTRIRGILLFMTGKLYFWPLYVVPLVVATVTLYYLMRKSAEDIQKNIPALVALSLFFAPYAWFYDYTLLLLVQLILVLRSNIDWTAAMRRKLYMALVVIQLFVLLWGHFDKDLGAFFWLPLCYLALWYFVCSKEKASGKCLSSNV